MKVKVADFLLTFKCPSTCKHCSYKAGPERKGHMNPEDIESYLQILAEAQPIQSVGAHGGEPFLYYELLKGMIETANNLGIHRIWVITNGYWAKDKSEANKKLAELKKAGLTSITFSVDSFHQEYIPLEHAKNGIEIAAGLGFERVCVDAYFLDEPNIQTRFDNIYDQLTSQGLENMEKLEVMINRRRVGFEGRAATELTKYVNEKIETPQGPCQIPFWIGGNLENPEGIEIDYEGNVTLCPGICIGNTKTTPLKQILEQYDVTKHPILSIIEEEGPIGLMKLATSNGFIQQKNFVNECNLCYEMRRFLRPRFPQHLAPQMCY
jgi:organic radical activating enzyme